MLDVCRTPSTLTPPPSSSPSPPPHLLYPPYHFDWPTATSFGGPLEPRPLRPASRSGFYTPTKPNSVKIQSSVADLRTIPSLKSGFSQIQEQENMYQNGYRAPSSSTDTYSGYSTQGSHHMSDTLRPSLPSRQSTIFQQLSQPSSQPASRPESPVFNEKQPSAGPGSSTIASYLLLPSTISPNGGSLAEFAAKVTCLFWFESAATLTQIQESQQFPPMTARLDTGFLKWVTTILTTTQVSPNVILLALLFIYRLKKQNPSVKGKPGSEFRLLTVALMLGNKFLDDNTYTNKTWAEVSGIAVQEIHVMEVEFLSHMKYNLYTSKEDWLEWHGQLKMFWAYFDHLSRMPRGHGSVVLRPLNLQIPPALPSPPNSTSASPPYTNSLSPHPIQQSNLASHLVPNLSPANSMATGEVDGRYAPRKRSWDEAALALEPQAKRPFGYYPHSATSEAPFSGTFPNFPSLPIPTSQPNMMQAPHLPAPTPMSARNTPTVSLPPVNWHQTPSMQGQGTAMKSRPSSFAFTSSNNPSPTPQPYPSIAAHTSNGSQLSPSHYLHHRNSPYKPVRNISTLLVPPPSGQLQQHPSISHDQMHWMPLGRASEQRTGRLPYLHREVWPSGQSGDWPASYPVHQQS